MCSRRQAHLVLDAASAVHIWATANLSGVGLALNRIWAGLSRHAHARTRLGRNQACD